MHGWQKHILLLQGDARRLPIAMASVQCAITSQPYWGLRDYGVPPSIWGGDPTCDHDWLGRVDGVTRDVQHVDQAAGANGGGQRASTTKHSTPGSAFCSRCGAWLGCFGLEPTPDLYVAHTVGIFREVRRVLRDDGILWLNLGDCYSNDTKWGGKSGKKNCRTAAGGYSGQRIRRGSDCDPKRGRAAHGQPMHHGCTNLKPKDMVGIPWRVAFALQEDGWYLRADCIWHKKNAMPSSVQDRPTTSHEYVFLLTKSERYYFDAVAVMEPTESGLSDVRKMIESRDRIGGKHKVLVDPLAAASSSTNIGRKRSVGSPAGRNLRTVWTINNHPFKGAHFATFPAKLVERCILAGTSERGACPTCGAPWARVGRKDSAEGRGSGNKERFIAGGGERDRLNTHMGSSVPWVPTTTTTTGWRPTCHCYDARYLTDVPRYARLAARGSAADKRQARRTRKRLRLFRLKRPAPPTWPTVPCVVLDNFNGAGTTTMVAHRLGRRAVGVERKAEYVEMQKKRITEDRGHRSAPVKRNKPRMERPEQMLFAIA